MIKNHALGTLGTAAGMWMWQNPEITLTMAITLTVFVVVPILLTAHNNLEEIR